MYRALVMKADLLHHFSNSFFQKVESLGSVQFKPQRFLIAAAYA